MEDRRSRSSILDPLSSANMECYTSSRLSYSHGYGMPLSDLTVGEVLVRTARANPEALCLVSRHQGIRMTYAQFLEAVDRASRAFLALGLQKGDRVAIWATNSAEWVITQFATARIGAILVNLNPAYRALELETALRASEAQTLILIQGFRSSDYIQILRSICPELEGVHAGGLRSAKLPELRNVIYLGEDVPPGLLGWRDFLQGAQAVPESALEERSSSLSFDDAINIQFTSGTTGNPKGATLSHHNIVNNARFIGAAMKIEGGDKVCIPVPFYHCFGTVLGNMVCVASGAAMVVPAASFDPLATLQAVHEERCTALYGVPTMFLAEIEHPDFEKFDLRSLRTGIMAGSPCPIELMRKVVEVMHCREMTIAYGLTEASPVITQTRAEDPIEVRVRTVGPALPNTEIKLTDPRTGRIVPIGQPGELCTRGYHVMKGYYKNPQATAEAIDEEGWLRSGDLATMDERGYVKITGRVKDMVIRGGENIYPREIEEFLYTHPKVSEVQVIGIPDARYGEEVMAWIRLKEGAECTAEEIKAFCKDRIAHYKIPRVVKFVSEFPMTVTGKVQKYKMQEMAIEEFGLKEVARVPTA